MSVIAVTAMLLLGGCGEGTGGAEPTEVPPSPTDEGPTDGAQPTESTDEPVPVDPSTEPSDPGTDPPDQPGVTELVGIPEEGVESGCRLLDGYLLLGGDQDLLSSGQRVRITGYVERDVMTTCQQGTPFRVETVEPDE